MDTWELHNFGLTVHVATNQNLPVWLSSHCITSYTATWAVLGGSRVEIRVVVPLLSLMSSYLTGLLLPAWLLLSQLVSI